MIDLTKPVQTEDGCHVEILVRDLSGKYPLLGVVTDTRGTKEHYTWTNKGEVNVGDTNVRDLVNATERRTIYVNVYPNHVASYNTAENATNWADSHAIAVALPVTFEVPA